MKNFFTDFKKYLFEVLAIITAITLSFLFDEWRDRRKDRRDSVELLSSIADNLKTDTTNLRLTRDYQETMIAAIRHVLTKPDSLNADSLAGGLIAFQTYPTFRKTDVGYLTMVQTGQSRVLTNKKLLNQINDLYQVQYRIIDEWTEIERQTVMEKNIAFINMHLPYVRYKYGSLVDNPKFRTLVKNDQFRNLLSTDYGFKSAMDMFYGNAQKAVDSLLRNVNTEIKKLED